MHPRLFNMSSHRYFWFYLCIMALPVTYVSARAPSEDTPIDQIVSCIYPMSGQYALLPRILFYACLIFASTMRRSRWFTNIVFGLAMPYSTTAFVHIIVIYATHGWNPPILDLDVRGIFLLGTTGVSMFPALVVLRKRYKNLAVQIVVEFWWHIMCLTSNIAAFFLAKLDNPRHNSNSEVACYLPDSTLLTSLAQLNGTRDLGCIYDCFLTRKSVLKTQDAVTVMWVTPANERLDGWGLLVGYAFSCIMFGLGSDMLQYPWILKQLDALLLKPMYSVYNQDGRAVMTPVACICLISMVPWVIINEYSLRSTPVEEMSFAIGQWAPWVAALFAIIWEGIYRFVKALKNGEGALELQVNSPEDYVMSGALIEPGGDIPIDDLLAPGRRDDTVSLNGSTHLLEEIDLGVYRTTSEPEG